MEHDESRESCKNLRAILKHSVFKSEKKLIEQLNSLMKSRNTTKIIISNLKRMDDGELELDFSSDEKDIRCREADPTATGQATSKYRTSLQAYCSILFLRPRMKITIRRQKVKTKIISKSLRHPMRASYKPGNSERKNPVDITFGFSCEKGMDESYGMMLYYKNRLIKPFVHVGCQKQPDGRGVGVVGVVDVDFLQPIHNKQDFNEDAKYKRSRVLQYRDAKGVILLDILPQGQCINAARYCSTLDCLKEAIRRKRPGLLRRGVVLQHYNATPHSVILTQQWLQRYGWEILPHPAHSPDLAPSDFHLFGPLKRHLRGMAFETEDDLISELRNWFDNLDTLISFEWISIRCCRAGKNASISTGITLRRSGRVNFNLCEFQIYLTKTL
ncbi:MORC family CW-type Zinc finger protein 3-like [Plakobranchus ocellatus]|uniref:MORC family CW-type Zinc finger protein 3-like n=1 Tax=Plakobranchus ocellatus TaxID=259542 RepID=A0AAV4BLZ1_9GAST|nr:MORC family CW-type Zinc finger protein 3-like [Plakobranchus ocellatus]